MNTQADPQLKYSILQNVFGYGSFRSAQENIIDNILAGKDALAVMPTGAGKSLCFQIPALMLDGITIVISPLISLMADQVTTLVQSGVRAAYFNSSLTFEQQQRVWANIAAGVYKIVYVAPERLVTDGFARLAERVKISMIAVDEAHCISQWGQDFRPSYMNIVTFAQSLPYRPIMTAFTATATEIVKKDIISILDLKDPYTITTGFDRPNLYFGVDQPSDKYAAVKKYLLANPGKSGIIYCMTRKNVEKVSYDLQKDGINALPYHAGMSDDSRRRNQEDFIYDRVQVIVATNAFGMGIDKSNVSFVIHYNMPKDMESYYQEAGRAGRDGEPAECLLLYGGQDYSTAKFLIENRSDTDSSVDEKTRRILISKDMKRLGQMMDYCSGSVCLRSFILGYFGENTSDGCGNCSVCLGNAEKKDITVEAQKIMSCIYRMGQKYGASTVCGVLHGTKNEKYDRLGFTSLSTYGILSDMTEKNIRILIDRLAAQKYVLRTDDEYPVLKLTSRSAAVLKGKERVEAIMPRERAEKARREKTAGEYSVDPALMEKLKKLRYSIASQKGIPPYHVFSDATLRDMCAKLPETKGEMLNVTGVGAKKLETYGEQFLTAIREWTSSHEKPKASAAERNAAKNPLETIAANSRKFNSVDDDITITQLSDLLIDAAGVNLSTNAVRTAVGKWLMDKGFLKEEKDRKGASCKAITPTSETIGIISVSRISQSGEFYKSVLYTPKAQKYIAAHFDEIALIGN